MIYITLYCLIVRYNAFCRYNNLGCHVVQVSVPVSYTHLDVYKRQLLGMRYRILEYSGPSCEILSQNFFINEVKIKHRNYFCYLSKKYGVFQDYNLIIFIKLSVHIWSLSEFIMGPDLQIPNFKMNEQTQLCEY